MERTSPSAPRPRFGSAAADSSDLAAAANGLTLNDHFLIRFQFYDNYDITIDGYAIDEIEAGSHRVYLPLVLRNVE